MKDFPGVLSGTVFTVILCHNALLILSFGIMVKQAE